MNANFDFEATEKKTKLGEKMVVKTRDSEFLPLRLIRESCVF